MAYIKQKFLFLVLTIVFSFGWFSFPAMASEITPERVVELVNEARLARGLSAVHTDARLTRAAQMKLNDMFDKEYFSHTSPDGTTPWVWIDKFGYDYTHAGENLAIHFTSAEKEQDAWMQSPTHRKNILGTEYTNIGVAVGRGTMEGVKTIVAVQFFGVEATPLAMADNFVPASFSKGNVPVPQVSGESVISPTPVRVPYTTVSTNWMDQIQTVALVVMIAVLAVSPITLTASLARMAQMSGEFNQSQHVA